MTGLWWCLTPIVWVVSAALWPRDAREIAAKDFSTSAMLATIISVPLWWALYWAIRLVVES